MLMYFEFKEERLKQNNLTQEQCFTVIDKVMNEYDVYANRPGTYTAPDESGFKAFSILKCNLPKNGFLKLLRSGSGLMMKMILTGMMKELTAFILFKSMECNL